MPLVYTSTEGASPQTIEIVTTNRAGSRATLQTLTTDIVDNTNPSVGALDFAFGAPLNLTLLAGGHRRGFYKMAISIYMRVAAAAGNVNGITLAWGEPLVGAATNVFGALPITTTGLILAGERNVLSDGILPLSISVTPAAVAGAPRGNICATAVYLSGPLS